MFEQSSLNERLAPVGTGLVRGAILSVLIGLMGGGAGVLAQVPDTSAAATTTAAATPTVPEQVAASSSGVTAAANAAPVATTATTPAPVKAVAPAKPAAPAAKKGKQVYTGPNTVVVQPATPMLDNEGKQRIDPDGNSMFNPPVKQIRDKKGHPEFDDAGKPIFETATNLGYDERGKKIPVKKVKPPKMTPVSISAGTLTVDGWTGKARLNYDIADLKFLYLYAPGIGTTIVSQNPFPGAKEQAGAFNDKTLHVTVDGHPIELWSEKTLLGKKPRPAWVLVDRGFLLPAKFPAVGYGATTKSPYMWPGAKDTASTNALVQPPPLPNDLRPTLQLKPCPAGMMRMAAPAALPGQKAPDQPCVPITSTTSPSVATATTPAAPATKGP
jgi:hypothetical protein